MGKTGSKRLTAEEERERRRREEEKIWVKGVCKLLTVGDSAVGKTCLLIREASGSFPTEYVPTVFDNYDVTDRDYGPHSLWDFSPSCGDYSRLRVLSYINVQCFLYCFDITNRDSFKSISETWIPETRHYNPGARGILVGTKGDLRGEGEDRAIKMKEAAELAEKYKMKYYECSALNGEGVENVFRAATLSPFGPLLHGPKRAIG